MTGPHITRERVERISFPLYGLPPGWEGDRGFGAGGRSINADGSSDIHSLELVHGGHDTLPTSHVIIRSTAPDPYAARYVPHVLGDGSVEGMLREIHERPALPTPEGYVPIEHPLTISVDGEPTQFTAVTAETWWMALFVGSKASIEITARNVDDADVELVRVVDFDRYFIGFPPPTVFDPAVSR